MTVPEKCRKPRTSWRALPGRDLSRRSQCQTGECVVMLWGTRSTAPFVACLKLHELRSSGWVADEQILFSWWDTSSNGLKVNIKDKLVNEPKAEFTWLKQNISLLHGEVRFSKVIIVFEFHLIFYSDWFRTYRENCLQSGFRDGFCCLIPKHSTSSSSAPSLQVSCMESLGKKGKKVKTILLQVSSLSPSCVKVALPPFPNTTFSYTYHLLWKWWCLVHSLS